MFLALFLYLIKSETYPDRKEKLEITIGGDFSIKESYFHDISLGESGDSVVMITNSEIYTYTLTVFHTTFSTCSAHINTLFKLPQTLRIDFDKNCIYNTQCKVEGAICVFSSIYNQKGGSPHHFYYTSISHTNAGYYIMSLQDASEQAKFELKYNNISHTTLTTTKFDGSSIGLIQIRTTKHDTLQNTFANNELSVCGCLYTYRCYGDQNYIHECNFIENNDIGNMMMYLDYCQTFVQNNYFLDNKVKDDTLMYIVGETTTISSNIYSGSKLYYRSNGATVYESNNQLSRITIPITHFATKFCLAQFPFTTPPPTLNPSPSIAPPTPEITPLVTPLNTLYTTPFTTPYTTPYYTPDITPYVTLVSTPLTTPYNTPYDTPFNTPIVTPQNTHIITSHYTPSIISENTHSTPIPSEIITAYPSSEEPIEPVEPSETPISNSPSTNEEGQYNGGNVGNDDSNGGSLLYIIIGCCLAAVVLIVVIIVIILIRRKKDSTSASESNSIDMDVEPVSLTNPTNAGNALTTVSLFSTNVEESDPFAQDFEEEVRAGYF